MKKRIILCTTITISIWFTYTLVLRHTNTLLNINGTEYFLGRYEFKKLIVKLNSNNKNVSIKEVLSYKYTTFQEDYHVHFRILNPTSKDTLFTFGDQNDTQYLIKYFGIQSKNREKFYKAKHQSLRLKVKKITNNKYAINISGTLFSISNNDSLVVKSDLLLTKQ